MELKVSDPCLLPEKSLGLSLSDQYWLCPAGSGLLWEKVNFFKNCFSEDVGNILFGNGSGSRRISLVSPDNTSDGWLKKKWKIIDGKRCLLKGGSGATQQEPYNEVLASRIMERLGICHVAYSLLEDGDYPYSLCEDFVTPDTELITAWHMMQRVKKPNHVSVYRHYLDCCEGVGFDDIRRAVDEMIVLDYIIVNEDCHLNNFGVVRRDVIEQYIRCRKERNITQAELARRAGIPRPNITRFESGTYNPSLEMMVRIASALGMKLEIGLVKEGEGHEEIL